MKILHVYRTYLPDTQGGVEEAIRQICAGTSAQGVSNEVLTLSPEAFPAVIERPEATVFRAPLELEIASCSMGRGLFKLFRERARHTDIVHFHFPWPFADVLAHVVPPQCTQVLTYHSDIVRQRALKWLYSPLMHRFLRRMDSIVATSDPYAVSSPVLRLYGDKLKVIPIGIDEMTYPDAPPALVREIQARFGRDFFLFVGVLRQYKGVQYLLDAAKGCPFTIVIAGAGPMEKKLRQQALAMGLTNVHFLGYVSDVMKMALLKACRALVLPSYQRSEAYGVSLVEGAMSGKALISTGLCTGTSFINQHGVTGLVVPPADAEALREALNRLYGAPGLAKVFGRAARQRYLELFRADVMARRYGELYSHLRRFEYPPGQHA